ncbi:hypothetical protein FACS1894185_1000 [Betaproteobacteria bacterium]|nr:hypothetical protein FACS1894185_1000 [Betaproteobacteria bacterium]
MFNHAPYNEMPKCIQHSYGAAIAWRFNSNETAVLMKPQYDSLTIYAEKL